MVSNGGCDGPLGKLGVNWAVCKAMPPRHPKAHLGHHGFTNPPNLLLLMDFMDTCNPRLTPTGYWEAQGATGTMLGANEDTLEADGRCWNHVGILGSQLGQLGSYRGQLEPCWVHTGSVWNRTGANWYHSGVTDIIVGSF